MKVSIFENIICDETTLTKVGKGIDNSQIEYIESSMVHRLNINNGVIDDKFISSLSKNEELKDGSNKEQEDNFKEGNFEEDNFKENKQKDRQEDHKEIVDKMTLDDLFEDIDH